MKKALIYLGVTTLFNIIFKIISRLSPAFSEWYATNIYPLIVRVFGGISGIFPFSVIEILIYILIALVIAAIVFFIIKLIKSAKNRVKILLNALIALSCAVSTIALIFLFGCGINYYRNPFSYYSGLTLEMYSAEDLRSVIEEVIGELSIITPQINTREDGRFILHKSKLNTAAKTSMRKLGEIYPCLNTYYPRPKPVLMSEQVMSPSLTCGFFSPYTIEANYNRKMPDSEIPFTICHELSHLNGFMREDEANFISFLACRESGDADFIYSGYAKALTYLINAYNKEAGREEYYEMYMTIPEQVRKEFGVVGDYWRPYYDTPVSKAASAVNDTYLKSNGQKAGVKSYGRFVDLLIADYLARH